MSAPTRHIAHTSIAKAKISIFFGFCNTPYHHPNGKAVSITAILFLRSYQHLSRCVFGLTTGRLHFIGNVNKASSPKKDIFE